MNILVVTSSASLSSTSTFLAQYAKDQVVQRYPEAFVEHLDLVQSLPRLIDQHVLQGMFGSEEHIVDTEHSNIAIEQLKRADLVIVAAPMYNFSVPAVLKGWIDQIARAGKTFQYTESGPRGLLTGKALAIVSSGGVYEQLPMMDHALPYLEVVLSFLGLTVEGVRAEGLAMGNNQDDIISASKKRIDEALKTLDY